MFRIKHINEDGTITTAAYQASSDKSKDITIPSSKNKLDLAIEILKIMDTGSIPMLYDHGMKQVSASALSMKSELQDRVVTLPLDAKMIFFTSGTSGNPTGVIKSKSNIDQEVATHQKWLQEYAFSQCLTTVPFIHIYGFLFGLAIPMALDLEVVTKMDFLPHEIIDISSQKPTLCITNPLFIRSMLRINVDADLSDSLFISSSGPLESSEALEFEQKFNTRLVQLYGSSETGGIAIRRGGEIEWSELDGVKISQEIDGTLAVSSPFVSQQSYNDGFLEIKSPYKTSDIVDITSAGFKVIGRLSEIIKIGGKRLSIIEMENFIESLEGVDEALLRTTYTPNNLRGENLSLYLVGNEEKVDKTILKKSIYDHFGGVHIESKIYFIDHISKTSLGKKIRENIALEVAP